MKNKKDEITNVFYHYCSVETFFNIINNNSFWLSDISKSNDSKELSWIKERGYEYLKQKMAMRTKALETLGSLNEVSLDTFNEAIEIIEHSISDETEKCWALCFSEKKDDLGQWRGYAQDASGIAIGIKRKYLEKLVGENKINPFDEKLHFRKVKYFEENETNTYFDMMFRVNDDLPSVSNEEFSTFIKNVVVSSLLFSPYHKNSYFKDESEWRLTFSMSCNELHRGKIPSVSKDYISSKYEYSLISGKLISHIELVFDNMPEAIESIWLGPKCSLSEQEVKLFLISKGYLKDIEDNSIEIRSSGATYR